MQAGQAAPQVSVRSFADGVGHAPAASLAGRPYQGAIGTRVGGGVNVAASGATVVVAAGRVQRQAQVGTTAR
jgi:hypothetical protein